MNDEKLIQEFWSVASGVTSAVWSLESKEYRSFAQEIETEITNFYWKIQNGYYND